MVWLIYLGPIFYVILGTAFQLYLSSTCDNAARDRVVTPCVFAGHDFSTWVEPGAMAGAGIGIVLGVIPWLAIGGAFVIFLKLADLGNE
jgi:hypothetical protein